MVGGGEPHSMAMIPAWTTLRRGRPELPPRTPLPGAGGLQEILAAKGITLEIQEYDDYVIPNTVVEEGEADTNYLQHQPYLDNFNEEKGTHLVTVARYPCGTHGHLRRQAD